MNAGSLRLRHLGVAEYEPTWRAMQDYTATRDEQTPDELWVVQHPPVYTLGIAARPEHLPRTNAGIPVVKIDRGGQITYHGPGQIVIYTLLDMKRRGLAVRPLIRKMEQAVIDLLAQYAIEAHGRVDAPGVYIGDAKIAAVGLRIRRGCCYHGLSFNADMDLQPFRDIDPCGYPGLAVTQARDLGITDDVETLSEKLTHSLITQLNT